MEVNLAKAFANTIDYTGALDNVATVIDISALDAAKEVGRALQNRIAGMNSWNAYPKGGLDDVLSYFGRDKSFLLGHNLLERFPHVMPRWLFEGESQVGDELSTNIDMDGGFDWIQDNFSGLGGIDSEDKVLDLLMSPFAEARAYDSQDGGLTAGCIIPPSLAWSAHQIYMKFSGVYDFTLPVPAVFNTKDFFIFSLNHELAHILRLNINPEAEKEYFRQENSFMCPISFGRDIEGFCDAMATLKHIQMTRDTAFPELIGQLRTLSVSNLSAQKSMMMATGEKARAAMEYHTEPYIKAAIECVRRVGERFYDFTDADLATAAYEIVRQEHLEEHKVRELMQLVTAPIYNLQPEHDAPSPREVQARFDEIEDFGHVKPRGLYNMMLNIRSESKDNQVPAGGRKLDDVDCQFIASHRAAMMRLEAGIELETKASYYQRVLEDLSQAICCPFNLAPMHTLLRFKEDNMLMAQGWVMYRRNGAPYHLDGLKHTEAFYDAKFTRAQRDNNLYSASTDPRYTVINPNMLSGVIDTIWRQSNSRSVCENNSGNNHPFGFC